MPRIYPRSLQWYIFFSRTMYYLVTSHKYEAHACIHQSHSNKQLLLQLILFFFSFFSFVFVRCMYSNDSYNIIKHGSRIIVCVLLVSGLNLSSTKSMPKTAVVCMYIIPFKSSIYALVVNTR